MVAQTNTPREPPRQLSAAVAAELADAFRATLTSDDTEGQARLKRALVAAASDARERGLTATDLLLAFKDIERRAFTRERGAPLLGENQARLRQPYIASLLRAYYSED